MNRVKNVGAIERSLRIIGGGLMAIIGVYLLLPPTTLSIGVLGVALALLGLDLISTGLTGYCPLYHRLGLSTVRAKTEQPTHSSDHGDC